MDTKIEGNYTAKRNGTEYTYEADWTVTGSQATWNAKVRCEGELHGTPNGIIHNVVLASIDKQVRALVENSIEIRAGVQ